MILRIACRLEPVWYLACTDREAYSPFTVLPSSDSRTLARSLHYSLFRRYSSALLHVHREQRASTPRPGPSVRSRKSSQLGYESGFIINYYTERGKKSSIPGGSG